MVGRHMCSRCRKSRDVFVEQMVHSLFRENWAVAKGHATKGHAAKGHIWATFWPHLAAQGAQETLAKSGKLRFKSGKLGFKSGQIRFNTGQIWFTSG